MENNFNVGLSNNIDLNLSNLEKKESGIFKLPHRCPICYGKGIVPMGFYNLGHNSYNTTTASASETCRSCSGQGVIWN